MRRWPELAAVSRSADTFDVILSGRPRPKVEARKVVSAATVIDHAGACDVKRTVLLGVASRSKLPRRENSDGVLNWRMMKEQRRPVDPMRVVWTTQRFGPPRDVRVGRRDAQAQDNSF